MFLLSRCLKSLIKYGTLVVIDASGKKHVYSATPSPRVSVRLHTPVLPWKLAVNPHLYLGEAYMDGTLTIEEGDVFDLLDILTGNAGTQYGGRLFDMIASINRVTRLLAQYNPVSRSRQNVAHHYDLSDELYALFLDRNRQYTCAYFADENDDLETAQAQKQAHIAAKLCIEPGQRVLDIGCGWGGLAFYLSQKCEAQVKGITLSQNQIDYATSESERLGLNRQVSFELKDYREIDERFDRIVSVGMFEHVGVPHFRTFFDVLYRSLKDDGVALLHTIGRMNGPAATNPWIKKYIFPGGYIPSLSEIVPFIERAGFYITDIEILRLHYAKTLRAWRQRFNANRRKIRALYDERFCRMWEFYLAVSEVAFLHGGHVVFQIQLAKKQDAVPLTRNYIGEWEDRINSEKAIAA